MGEVRVLGTTDSGALARLADIPRAAPTDGWVWVDLLEPTEEQIEAGTRAIGVAEGVLGTVRADAFPSARVHDRAVVLTIRGLTQAAERISTTPVTIVLGRAGVLTIRFKELPGIAWLADRAVEGPAVAAVGADGLVAWLVEIGAERFLPLADGLDASVEALEDRAIEAHPEVLTESHALRRDASLLRSVLRAQREVVRTVVRARSPLMGPAAIRRLEDAYDVHNRLVESLETARIMLTGVIEVYRSAVAERTNEVMKVLTVFAAIMLPLSLIAGIYGMNFARMPELQVRWAYFAVLGAMAAVATGLWLYFARRGFIGGPRLRARTVGRGLVTLAGLPIKTVTTVTKIVGRAVIPGADREDEGTGREE